MAEVSNNFEGGIADNDISTDFAVGGGTPFFDAAFAAGCTCKYSSASPYDGGFCLKVRTGATGGTAGVRWDTTAFGSLTDYYTRFFFKTDSVTSPGSSAMFRTENAGGSTMGAFGLSFSGHFEVYNAAFAVVATSSMIISAGVWYRIEGFVHGSTTAAYQTWRIYSNPTSGTITEQVDSSSTPWTSSSATHGRVFIGTNSGPPNWPTSNTAQFAYFDKWDLGRVSGYYGPDIAATGNVIEVPSPPF